MICLEWSCKNTVESVIVLQALVKGKTLNPALTFDSLVDGWQKTESCFRDALKNQIIIHHSIAYLETNLFLFFSTEWLHFLCACGSVAGLRSRAVNRDRIVDTNSQGPASLCGDVRLIQTQLEKK